MAIPTENVAKVRDLPMSITCLIDHVGMVVSPIPLITRLIKGTRRRTVSKLTPKKLKFLSNVDVWAFVFIGLPYFINIDFRLC